MELKDDEGLFLSGIIPVLHVLWWPQLVLARSEASGVEGTDEAAITAGFSFSEMLSVEEDPLSSRASIGK